MSVLLADLNLDLTTPALPPYTSVNIDASGSFNGTEIVAPDGRTTNEPPRLPPRKDPVLHFLFSESRSRPKYLFPSKVEPANEFSGGIPYILEKIGYILVSIQL